MRFLEMRRRALNDRICDALSASPVVIIAAKSGTGKSAAIDDIFTYNGTADRSSAIVVRLDHTITDFHALVSRFANAIGVTSYEDSDSFSLVEHWINRAPSDRIIVVDNLQYLAKDTQATNFIVDLVNATVGSDRSLPRRWLLSTQDVDMFPHAVWLARGNTTIIANPDAFLLTDAECDIIREKLSLSKHSLVPRNLREANRRFLLQITDALGIETQKNTDTDSNTYPPNINKHLAAWLFSCNQVLVKKARSICLLNYLDFPTLGKSYSDYETILSTLEQIGILRSDPFLETSYLDDDIALALQESLIACDLEELDLAARLACAAGPAGADIAKAMDLLIDRSAWTNIISLLGEYGFGILDREPLHGIVAGTIGRLPKELLNEYPALSGLQGVVTARIDFGDVSEAWFRCSLMHENIPEALRREVSYRYGLELARRARPDTLDILKPLLREYLELGSAGHGGAALTFAILAAVATQTDDNVEARSHLANAIDLLQQTFDPYVHAHVLHYCSYVFYDLGEFSLASEFATDSIRISARHRFFDLASRTASIRQALAYRIEHDTPLALSYIDRMISYADRAGEARMNLVGWLSRYWMAIELGDEELLWECKQQIDRSAACDDYMQKQIRFTIVPGSAMVKAWRLKFSEAAALVQPYTKSTPAGIDRAFRWSELAIYHAGDYCLTKREESRSAFRLALHQTRVEIESIRDHPTQEADIVVRVVIALLIMNKVKAAEKLSRWLVTLSQTDRRAPAMLHAIDTVIAYWRGGATDTRAIRAAMKELVAIHLGGIARLISAMPTPTELQPLTEIYA